MANKHHLFKEIILNETQIEATLTKLASKLNETYVGHYESVLAIGVLKGCLPFMADLMKKLNFDMQTEYVKASSYYKSAKVGVVKCDFLFDPQLVTNRHLLVFDDIVDGGDTLKEVMNCLRTYQPASIKLVTLFTRKTNKPDAFFPDFCENYLGPGFLIGYGLDYNGYLRNIPYVGILDFDVEAKLTKANHIYTREERTNE